MYGSVLADWQIIELIESGAIPGARKKLVTPGSLDLTISPEAHKLIGSIKPLRGQRVSALLKKSGVVDTSEKNQGSTQYYIEREAPYLFRLEEALKLPKGISARVFNKSGRGRIGTLVTVMADGIDTFNSIPQGYRGKLYAEVCSTAFSLKLDLGRTTLPQIRFYNGEPRALNGEALEHLLKEIPILFDQEGNPLRSSRYEKERIRKQGTLCFTADLSREVLAYRAKRDEATLDLFRRNHYDPGKFFEEVKRDKGHKGLVMHPGEFFLVHSNEQIRLPLDHCAEIAEYNPALGDMKTHYAGLINPGHGHEKRKSGGYHIVFEIRALDKPIFLQHGQPLAYFEILPMDGKPKISYAETRSTNFDSLAAILPTQFKKN